MRIFRFAMNADAEEYSAEERRLLGLKPGEKIVKPKVEPETGSGWEHFKKHKRGKW